MDIPNDDRERSVDREGPKSEIYLPGEKFRNGDADRRRTIDKGDGRSSHEDQPDG